MGESNQMLNVVKAKLGINSGGLHQMLKWWELNQMLRVVGGAKSHVKNGGG